MGFIGVQPTSIPLTSSDITDGIISTAKIADNAVTLAKIPSSAITGNFPTGAVLQTLQSVKKNDFNSASTNYADITGTDQDGSGSVFCVKITPSATSSKVLILVQCHIVGDDSVGLQLVRDTTSIFLADADGSRQRYTMLGLLGTGSNETYNAGANHIHFLDSPSSTSELTYKVQGKTRGGSFYINRSVYDADNNASARSVSSITVQEIKG